MQQSIGAKPYSLEEAQLQPDKEGGRERLYTATQRTGTKGGKTYDDADRKDSEAVPGSPDLDLDFRLSPRLGRMAHSLSTGTYSKPISKVDFP